jgi:predicted DNA-binding transcriptional regulator YafY
MEDIRDFELIVCGSCGQIKKRIRDGKRVDSKETRFVDESGKEWNGRKYCPPCHTNKVVQRKKLKDKLVKQAKELSREKT